MTKLLTLTVATLIAIPAAAPAFAAAERLSGVWTQDATSVVEKRRKPRVPGGSGCDSARDRAEHPECRG